MSAGDLVSGEIKHTATPRTIETEEFYDLMQAYRFADAANQIVVADRFGAIVDHVDAKLAAHDDLVTSLNDLYTLIHDMGWTTADDRYASITNAAAVLAKAGANN